MAWDMCRPDKVKSERNKLVLKPENESAWFRLGGVEVRDVWTCGGVEAWKCGYGGFGMRYGNAEMCKCGSECKCGNLK